MLIVSPKNVTAAVTLAFVLGCATVWGQAQRGFSFNNLNVSPFLNLEYTYDSNVSYDSSNERDDYILRVNPGVDIGYQGNEWGLKGSAWYAYDWYQDDQRLNASRYGESLDFYRESAKGWKLMLGQTFIKSSQDDSVIDGGRGLWRERKQWDFTGALAYEFSERMSATLTGLYSDLSYLNDDNQFAPLYGWEEWCVGLELARKLTEKSNVLLSGSYQAYYSDGAQGISGDSSGYNLHVGFNSRATERIRYRVLTGVTWFDYAGGDLLVGWTYSVDASWKINNKLAASLVGSSNFQPSEREVNQAQQYYVLSAGLTYKPRPKLTTRFDLAFRREENQYDVNVVGATTDDRFTARARADYRLTRLMTVYGMVEYENQVSDDSESEFDRIRASLGLNFRY